MVADIQFLARDVLDRCERADSALDIEGRFKELAEELSRLAPHDFPPALRDRFIDLRHTVQVMARPADRDWWELIRAGLAARARAPSTPTGGGRPVGGSLSDELAGNVLDCCRRAVELLDAYGGSGGRPGSGPFDFMEDPGLRDAAERDCRELALVLYPGQAWNSVVTVAGRVLDAVLYDQLTRDPARTAAALAAEHTPKKDPGAVPRDITVNEGEDEWTLADLIDVSVELGLIPEAPARGAGQVLRGRRSLTHGGKGRPGLCPCTAAEATRAKDALGAIINHLQLTVRPGRGRARMTQTAPPRDDGRAGAATE